MKKLLQKLLLASIVFGSANATTNKTFLLPRSHGVNLAMEYTTWNELINMPKEDRFGANFQATVFYQDSSESDDLGKYFAFQNKNIVKLGNVGEDLTHAFIFHDSAVTINTETTIKLDPDQSAWGVRIDYYQDLEKILKGLYLKAALPIVNVDNDVRLGVSDSNGFLTDANVTDYFKGTFLNTAAANINKQDGLTKAKFTGSHSETSVADIDFVIGYKFLDKEKYHMSINLGLTIPTGTDPDGIDIFEAVVGNGNHWGFGGGLDFGATLWDGDDQNIKFTSALNYRYIFESSETRTLGLKNTAGTLLDWGQYYLVGKVGDTSGTPAANILTTSVDVEPGSQLDFIAALAYNNGGFSIDLGYNLFWKDHEDVSLKNWTDDVYGLIANRHDMTTALTLVGEHWSNGTVNSAQAYDVAGTIKINKANIDTGVAETESSVTHKIYGGLGYIFKEWEYPLMLGVAGHYEFADNDGIENWGIWGKLGIAF
ncbi:hypothetical protein ACFLYH_01670 [Candidatus Dependentiae bacterium]